MTKIDPNASYGDSEITDVLIEMRLFVRTANSYWEPPRSNPAPGWVHMINEWEQRLTTELKKINNG